MVITGFLFRLRLGELYAIGMAQALRYDFTPIKRWEKTPEGYLRIEATIARTGVQEYRRADGSVQLEYRPPEEVGNPASLKSFEDKPVTLEHPPVLLNAENTREYQRGHLRDVHFDASTGLVKAWVFVTDAEAIASIERGDTREFSCGYEVEAREEPGFTPTGSRYDVLQTKIRGNHGAITKRARAGSGVRLHLDSADAIAEAACDGEGCSCGESCDCDSCQNKSKKKRRAKGMATATIKINDSEFEVSEAVAAALGAERATTKLKMDALMKDGYGKKKKAMPDEMMDEDDEEEMAGMMDEDDEEDDEEWDDDAGFMEQEPKKKGKMTKKDSIPALKGRIDALTEYITELEEQIQQSSAARIDSDEFQAAVDRRVAAVLAATAILGPTAKFDGMTDREILEAAFEEVSDEDVSDRTDDYIQGKLDALIESQSDRGDSTLETVMAGAMTREKKADLKTIQHSQCERWKQPLRAAARR